MDPIYGLLLNWWTHFVSWIHWCGSVLFVCLRAHCGTYATVPRSAVWLPDSMPVMRQLFCVSLVRSTFWIDGPTLFLELTGVALCCVSAWGPTVVPIQRCRVLSKRQMHFFCQSISPPSRFFSKSLNQRLYKFARLAVKDLIDWVWVSRIPKVWKQSILTILLWIMYSVLEKSNNKIS